MRIEELVEQAKQERERVEKIFEPDHGLLHARELEKDGTFQYRYASHLGVWMAWQGGVWRPVPEERVALRAANSLHATYTRNLLNAASKEERRRWASLAGEVTRRRPIQDALYFYRGMPGVTLGADVWDRDPWLLNLKNGAIDLKDWRVRDHSERDFCTKQANVAFDPDADGPRWRAHLERFLPDPDIRRQVQRDLGVALVGAVLEECLPIWWGEGANGKTTTARVLMELLGDYAAKAAPNLLVHQRFQPHPTGIADLAGRRLVFSAETEADGKLAEALLKDLTGGDRKKARLVHKDFFEFDQTFSIVLITNHLPQIAGTDWAIWRRIRLIPWTVTIPEDEQRPQDEVVAELLEEAPAILNWLLDGLRDWQAEPHWVAPGVQAATAAYRRDQDILAGFLAERCTFGPTLSVGVGDLYAAYEAWCAEVGCAPVSKHAFGPLLKQRGITQDRRTGGKRVWVGIALSDNSDRSIMSS